MRVVVLSGVLIEKYGPFMDTKELAELFKIKQASLYQQLYQGKLDIPHAKLGKKYLFPTSAVAQYMTSLLTSSAVPPKPSLRLVVD